MFEFLFKYAPELFELGVVQLQWPWPRYALAAAALAAAGMLLSGYLRRGTAVAPARRLLLGVSRGALLALLLLLLCQPVLVVSLPETLRGSVAVLLDDSQSMRIADVAGETRASEQQRMFAPAQGSIAQALEQRFDTRYYRFGAQASALRTPDELRRDGARSDLAAALRRLREDHAQRPPGAVVVVSDGALETGPALEAELLALRADGVAVHTVGVGADTREPDVELLRVQLAPRLLEGDAVEAEVLIAQRGLGGRPLRLQVTEDGLLLHEQLLSLPDQQSLSSTRVPLQFTEPGSRRLRFALETQPGERLHQNNWREHVVDVRAAPARVLHFEGEPRFEVKFLRRALTGDPTLRLVSLVRTAENKFYRMGVEHADELRNGFPDQAEVLFDYTAVVLGSVERAQLDERQQALLGEFVARRGGSLLLLGGRYSFAEGGHDQGPLVDLLPVHLDSRRAGFSAAVTVAATSAGAAHPVVRAALSAFGADTLAGLPALTVRNPIERVKPGATLLLRGERGLAPPLVVFAHHRYGRGTVAVLAVTDTWRWQMHQQIAVDDQTHEVLWRQLLRWLVRPVRGRIELRAEPAQPVPGETVHVSAEVVDAAYRPLAGANVRLTLTTATGDQHELPMAWASEEEGLYRASFTASDSGLHELHARLLAPADAEVTSRALSLDVTDAGEEFHGAALNRALLQRLAADTGGRYVDVSDAADLADALTEPTGARTRTQHLPLWDAPGLLLALLLLAGLEWGARRLWGLP